MAEPKAEVDYEPQFLMSTFVPICIQHLLPSVESTSIAPLIQQDSSCLQVYHLSSFCAQYDCLQYLSCHTLNSAGQAEECPQRFCASGWSSWSDSFYHCLKNRGVYQSEGVSSPPRSHPHLPYPCGEAV